MADKHELVLVEFRDDDGHPRRMRVRPDDVPEGAEIIDEPKAEVAVSEDVQELRDEITRLNAVVADNEETIARLDRDLQAALGADKPSGPE